MKQLDARMTVRQYTDAFGLNGLPAVAGGFLPPFPPPAGTPIERRDHVGLRVADTREIASDSRPTAAPRDAFGVRADSDVPASRDTQPAAAGSVPPHTRPPAGELVDPLALELGDAAVWGPSHHSANVLWLFALVLFAPIWVIVVLVLGAFNVRFGGRKS